MTPRGEKKEKATQGNRKDRKGERVCVRERERKSESERERDRRKPREKEKHAEREREKNEMKTDSKR